RGSEQVQNAANVTFGPAAKGLALQPVWPVVRTREEFPELQPVVYYVERHAVGRKFAASRPRGIGLDEDLRRCRFGVEIDARLPHDIARAVAELPLMQVEQSAHP